MVNINKYRSGFDSYYDDSQQGEDTGITYKLDKTKDTGLKIKKVLADEKSIRECPIRLSLVEQEIFL